MKIAGAPEYDNLPDDEMDELTIGAIRKMVSGAVAQERERCARIADTLASAMKHGPECEDCNNRREAAKAIAAAIRSQK